MATPIVIMNYWCGHYYFNNGSNSEILDVYDDKQVFYK